MKLLCLFSAPIFAITAIFSLWLGIDIASGEIPVSGNIAHFSARSFMIVTCGILCVMSTIVTATFVHFAAEE